MNREIRKSGRGRVDAGPGRPAYAGWHNVAMIKARSGVVRRKGRRGEFPTRREVQKVGRLPQPKHVPSHVLRGMLEQSFREEEAAMACDWEVVP